MHNISCPLHPVPKEFKSEAIRKGRALEWARKNVECNKEYILYIDEDTIIRNFDTIPDADIVQFRETPTYAGSLTTYLTEIYRVGYQFEQSAFGAYRYPIYAWGGGIAIRNSLEDKVTWDQKIITEDTSFAWRAVNVNGSLSFAVSMEEFYNQAPTSMKSLFKQRRRWASGTIIDSKSLPINYRLLVYIRLFIWAYSPLVFLNGLIIFLFPDPLFGTLLFMEIIISELIIIHLTTLIGVIQFRGESKLIYLALPLTVILSVVNSIDAWWDVISPASDFAVTKKKVLEDKVQEKVDDILDQDD